MSLLNKASLIQIPSGYKDGTLYSAKPTNGDGDFTFSRGSNLAATRVNSEGLIEKGRENLLLQSNGFNQAGWGISSATITGGQSGYDGSSNAWLLDSSSEGYLFQYPTSSNVGTLSIYAKANSVNNLRLRTFGASINAEGFFDLANGVVGSSTNLVDLSIESIGGGWYRCSVVYDNAPSLIRIYPSVSSSTSSGTIGSIYIQDAQLEVGLVSTDVITTTTTTEQAGILEDMPRLDYSGGATCGHLLLEPQRTNLFETSEYFGASSWNKTNITLTTNDSESVEGVDNATLMYPNATSSGATYLYNITSGSASKYTISAFVKADGKDVCWLYIDSSSVHGLVYFDLSDESIQAVAGSNGTPTGTITNIGNNWYRVTCTIPLSAAISGGSGIGVSDAKGSFAVTKSGEDGILVYGLQLEAGSYPTSYIPTYGSSVTRSVDFGSNSTNTLGGLSEGTFFIEMSRNGIDTNETGSGISLRDNSGVEEIRLHFDAPTSQVRWRDGNNSFAQIGGALSITAQTTFKILVKTDGTTAKVFGNGTQLGSDYSIVSAFDLQRIYNNGLGYQIKQQLFFPTALTDDECEQLTTI